MIFNGAESTPTAEPGNSQCSCDDNIWLTIRVASVSTTLHAYVSFPLRNTLQYSAVLHSCLFRFRTRTPISTLCDALFKAFASPSDRFMRGSPRLVWSLLLRPHHMITSTGAFFPLLDYVLSR